MLADIGFDASGNLDAAAVAAHLNGANGYVAVWFDQSGTGHDFGVAAASQPQLVLSGLNGKPAFSFNGSNQYFDDLYNITHDPGDWTMVAAMESVTSGGTDHIFTTRWYSPANSISFLSLTNISRYGFEVDNVMYHSPGGAVAGPHCYGIVLESPNKAQIRLDGAALASNLTYSPHGMYANSRIGRAVGSVYYFQGLLSELIIWPRTLAPAELALQEGDQSNYFIDD